MGRSCSPSGRRDEGCSNHINTRLACAPFPTDPSHHLPTRNMLASVLSMVLASASSWEEADAKCRSGSSRPAASGSQAAGGCGAAVGSACRDPTAAGPATQDSHQGEDEEAVTKHGIAKRNLGELVTRTLEVYAAALGRSFTGRGQEGEQEGAGQGQQGEGAVAEAAALAEWYALACEAAGSYAMAVAAPGEQQRLADMMRLNLGPLPAMGKRLLPSWLWTRVVSGGLLRAWITTSVPGGGCCRITTRGGLRRSAAGICVRYTAAAATEPSTGHNRPPTLLLVTNNPCNAPSTGTLPSPPPRRLAAALAGGYLPCLERLLRRCGRCSTHADVRLLQLLLPPGAHTSDLLWALAYGDPKQATSLVLTLAKVLARLDEGWAAGVVEVVVGNRTVSSAASTAAVAEEVGAMATGAAAAAAGPGDACRSSSASMDDAGAAGDDPACRYAVWTVRTASLVLGQGFAWGESRGKDAPPEVAAAAEALLRQAGAEAEAEAVRQPRATVAEAQLVGMATGLLCQVGPGLSRALRGACRTLADQQGQGQGLAELVGECVPCVLQTALVAMRTALKHQRRGEAHEEAGRGEKAEAERNLAKAWEEQLLGREHTDFVQLVGAVLNCMGQLPAGTVAGRIAKLATELGMCIISLAGHRIRGLLLPGSVGTRNIGGVVVPWAVMRGPDSPPPVWLPGKLREAAEAAMRAGDRATARRARELAEAVAAWSQDRHYPLDIEQSVGRMRGQLWLVSPEEVGRRLAGGCCSNGACVQLEGDSEAAVKLRRCGGCKAVRYCCQECQAADWAAGHKQACRAR